MGLGWSLLSLPDTTLSFTNHHSIHFTTSNFLKIEEMKEVALKANGLLKATLTISNIVEMNLLLSRQTVI